MRKWTAILAGILLLVAITPALAEAPPIKLIVNGKEVAMDVAPVNIDGRVYVPARYVAEALGATVEWDAATQAVVITSVTTASGSTQPAIEPSRPVIPYVSATELASRHGFTVTYVDRNGWKLARVEGNGHWAEIPMFTGNGPSQTSDSELHAQSRLQDGELYLTEASLRQVGIITGIPDKPGEPFAITILAGDQALSAKAVIDPAGNIMAGLRDWALVADVVEGEVVRSSDDPRYVVYIGEVGLTQEGMVRLNSGSYVRLETMQGLSGWSIIWDQEARTLTVTK